MKIAESNVTLDASHQSLQRHQREERLEIWSDDVRNTTAPPKRTAVEPATKLSLSSEAASLKIHCGEIKAGENKGERDAMADFDVSLLKLLVERITGRRLRLFDPADVQAEAKSPESIGDPQQAPAQDPGSGFGLRYEYHEIHHESEQTGFRAQGIAKTEDGQEIRFDVQLNMSREFTSEQHLQLLAGDALKDPLVLNFSASAAQLTQRDFRFDLDLDGQPDQIAFVGSGSGFLALDRNNDGQINDGSELFGPTSGDGFAELGAYDSDGNQWIDENDPIYDRLRIWSRSSDGSQQLLGLGAHGVGVIYLGSVTTPFQFNDSVNNQLGELADSGVFLKESGEAGTIQQINLVV